MDYQLHFLTISSDKSACVDTVVEEHDSAEGALLASARGISQIKVNGERPTHFAVTKRENGAKIDVISGSYKRD